MVLVARDFSDVCRMELSDLRFCPEPPGHGCLPWEARAWYERAARHERACLSTSPAGVLGFVERAGGLVIRLSRGGIMSPHASSVTTLSLETGPGQRPAGPRLALAESPPPAQRGRFRPLEVGRCSMCGIALPFCRLVGV